MAAILRLETRSFGREAWTKDLFLWYAKTFPKLFLVAKKNGHMAGYCAGSMRGKSGDIDSIAVAARYKRRHVATELLNALIRRLKRSGAVSIDLMVRRDNAAAIALYRKIGFVRTRTIAGYYEDGAAAWRMRLFVAI
jgi:[ribosomal protein S18]-alanine N-acetyltransferase